MKSKDALRILGVSRVTLWSYVKSGKIKATKLSNGYYDYDDKSIYDFIGQSSKINIIYARVSTHKQKNDLSRQTSLLKDYCKKIKLLFILLSKKLNPYTEYNNFIYDKNNTQLIFI